MRNSWYFLAVPYLLKELNIQWRFSGSGKGWKGVSMDYLYNRWFVMYTYYMHTLLPSRYLSLSCGPFLCVCASFNAFLYLSALNPYCLHPKKGVWARYVAVESPTFVLRWHYNNSSAVNTLRVGVHDSWVLKLFRFSQGGSWKCHA